MAAVDEELTAGTSRLSTKEKIERGVTLKVEGNEYFKKKDYRDAMKSYHKALLHVKGLIDRPFVFGLDSAGRDISEEDKEKIYQVQFSCYNNLAGSLRKIFFCLECFPLTRWGLPLLLIQFYDSCFFFSQFNVSKISSLFTQRQSLGSDNTLLQWGRRVNYIPWRIITKIQGRT